MTRRKLLGLGLAALSAPLMSPWARAQARYPERAIRLVIPFPPGGVNDAVGRPWADKMKGLLGTVVVENIGGAGGGLGAAAVARARPDGYTLLLGGMGSQVIVGVAADRAAWGHRAHHRGASVSAGADTHRADRLCQGQPRQTVVRLLWRRRHDPP